MRHYQEKLNGNSDIEFDMDIQTSQLAVHNHVNNVTNDQVSMSMLESCFFKAVYI